MLVFSPLSPRNHMDATPFKGILVDPRCEDFLEYFFLLVLELHSCPGFLWDSPFYDTCLAIDLILNAAPIPLASTCAPPVNVTLSNNFLAYE